MHPEYAAILFSDVRWVLVDEIHSFIGNDRGYQLRSLLERIKRYMHTDPRYIGMSATLGKKDMEAVKRFFRRIEIPWSWLTGQKRSWNTSWNLLSRAAISNGILSG